MAPGHSIFSKYHSNEHNWQAGLQFCLNRLSTCILTENQEQKNVGDLFLRLQLGIIMELTERLKTNLNKQ